MTAPVVGYTAEVPQGLYGESFVQIELKADVPPDRRFKDVIEISLHGRPNNSEDWRMMIVSHDEARQIIAGLASVIE